MFINISNHPPEKWGPLQHYKATRMGSGLLQHLPFPNVPPTATTAHVSELARELYCDIDKLLADQKRPIEEDFFYCLQGEFSLCYALKPLLDEMGGHCYVPTTERRSVETKNADGTTTKTQVFEFVQWREVPQ